MYTMVNPLHNGYLWHKLPVQFWHFQVFILFLCSIVYATLDGVLVWPRITSSRWPSDDRTFALLYCFFGQYISLIEATVEECNNPCTKNRNTRPRLNVSPTLPYSRNWILVSSSTKIAPPYFSFRRFVMVINLLTKLPANKNFRLIYTNDWNIIAWKLMYLHSRYRFTNVLIYSTWTKVNVLPYTCLYLSFEIQSSIVITRSIVIRYYRNWGRILIWCWIHKRPNGRAFVNICEKIDRVITAPLWNWIR